MMQTRFARTLLLSLWLLAGVACAQHAAMVTDLEGRVELAGGARLSILSDLDAGAQVQLALGARMVAVYLASGDEYAFRGPAVVRFGADQPQVVSGVKAQKRTTRMGEMGVPLKVRPEGLAQAAIVMRSVNPAASFRLLSPLPGKTLDPQPEFRWTSLGAGLTYRFELRDRSGKVLSERSVDGASLRLPATVALKEGAPLVWDVSVRAPDGERHAASGEFTIAAEDLRTRVAALRPAPDAPLSERVTFAAWLEQMELRDEARKYWVRASRERPDDARLRRLAAE
jgi:hypothetical protein